LPKSTISNLLTGSTVPTRDTMVAFLRAPWLVADLALAAARPLASGRRGRLPAAAAGVIGSGGDGAVAHTPQRVNQRWALTADDLPQARRSELLDA
jgi:hypothetical protein